MDYSTDDRFNNAKELLNFFIDHDWFKTGNMFHANFIGKAGMVFRGQSNASWKLVPSAFRPNALENFTPQQPATKAEIDSNHVRLGSHLHAENRAVSLFLQAADDTGIPTPIDYTNASHGLDLLNAAFDEVIDYDYSKQYPPISFQREFALAQHHGVPTRFLDWSESPFVACFFAAYGASVFATETPSNEQEISVVFIESNTLQRIAGPMELIQAPKFENSHLLRQRGLFTSFKNANTHFLKYGDWPSMENYNSSTFAIHRRRLPASEANNLLRELFDLDVTRLSLMPTLNNAANHFLYVKKLFSTD